MGNGKLFKMNDNHCYTDDPHVAKNTFIGREADKGPLPKYEDIKGELPHPIWDGHDDAIACYNKVWELAFGNLHSPKAEAGFVSNFIDSAFSDYFFMWDSSFIMMFTKYASRVFNFQRTLDNFYSHQHRDGFISREINVDEGGENWTRDDPCSTGPNVLPFSEWEYFKSTGDMDRLSKVFDPLLAYHKWLQLNRTWQDGTYWSCGNACGMDNLPRTRPEYNNECHHSFMSWIDTCCQQYLSGVILTEMGKILGREDETLWLAEEAEMLYNTINEKMWNEEIGLYNDKLRDGTVSSVKTVAPFWTLISGIATPERAERMVAHLEDEREFKRPNRVPALSADNPYYLALFGYWGGGVWAPTNYMILRGLDKYGYHDVARDIAVAYHDYIINVYRKMGTVFEYYSPELPYNNSGKRDFVGWSGIGPVAVLFEYVFGINSVAKDRHIRWRINCLERHGVEKYPLGDVAVDLVCEARVNEDERPVISVKSPVPVTVEVIWKGESWTVTSTDN